MQSKPSINSILIVFEGLKGKSPAALQTIQVIPPAEQTVQFVLNKTSSWRLDVTEMKEISQMTTQSKSAMTWTASSIEMSLLSQ